MKFLWRGFCPGGNVFYPVSALDGHSLVGLLAGTERHWNNGVISEYTGEGVNAPCRMLRRNNFKYIYTHGHPPLLYDLEKDPLELENLIGNPTTAEIESALSQEILENWEPESIAAQCLQSQKERLFIQSATQGNPTWAHINRLGDDQRYIRNASAVGVKGQARYPFVEPTPFER